MLTAITANFTNSADVVAAVNINSNSAVALGAFSGSTLFLYYGTLSGTTVTITGLTNAASPPPGTVFAATTYASLGSDPFNVNLLAGNDQFAVNSPVTARFNVDAGNDADSIVGGPGNDTLTGGAGADTLRGGDGNDSATGGTENDSLFGDAGADNIQGQDGVDVLDGGSGNDTIRGGAGNDSGVGGDDNDSMFGEDGNDNMQGQNGSDTLLGGPGADTLRGQAGNDFFYDNTVNGSEGLQDVLDGGADFDTVEFHDDGLDSLTSIEDING